MENNTQIIDKNWIDPDDNLIENRKFFSKEELKTINYQPKGLIDNFFDENKVQLDFSFKNKTGLSIEELLNLTK